MKAPLRYNMECFHEYVGQNALEDVSGEWDYARKARLWFEQVQQFNML